MWLSDLPYDERPRCIGCGGELTQPEPDRLACSECNTQCLIREAQGRVIFKIELWIDGEFVGVETRDMLPT